VTRIRVSTVIEAAPREVWAAIEDIESHSDWMEDAVAVRLTSRRHRGTGTTFDCVTRVGPFCLTDRMEITEWRRDRVMGVRHGGLVTGEGRLKLSRGRRRTTKVTWHERLRFPWWMGGPFTGFFGARVLARVWRRSLQNLKWIVEGDRGQAGAA
jgi:hypothetical protein